MANTAVVGILRTLLTADASGYASGFAKATAATEKQTQAEEKLRQETIKLTPQAERMAKAFGGDRLLYSANNLVAAINKVGGATKLTSAEQARSNATLTAAIQKYAVLGKEAPAAMIAAEKATRGASSATSLLATTFGTLAASFSTALIVNRIVGGLVSLGNEAIASAGALVDLSAKTGLSTETLQRMGHVAGQTQGNVEDFANAAFKLGINVASGTKQARDAFEDLSKASTALGMSFADFQKLRPDEQFARVTAALHDVQDEQERNRIGVALMGKQYAAIAAAIAQNYNEMAKAAKVSTDAQIRALDDAADAWTKFVHDVGIGIQQNLGNVILWAAALKQAVDELGIFASTRSVVARAEFILQEGLNKQRTTDIELTKQTAAAHLDYVAQLKAVQAELAKLTPTQRANIDAALKLGEKQEDLEHEFHLSEGALKVYSDALTQNTKDTKAAEKAADELREKIDALFKDVFGISDRLEDQFDKISDAELFKQIGDEISGVADHLEGVIDRTTEATNRIGQIIALQRQNARISADIAQQRTEFEIDAAKDIGDNWRDVFALEQKLSRQRRDAAIADVQAEFEARTAALRKRLSEQLPEGEVHDPLDEQELAQQTKAVQLQIQQIMEAFNLEERNRAAVIRRTHNIWLRSWLEMRTTSEQVIGQISLGIARLENDLTGNLTSLIFGFDPDRDPTGELRKAADEAKRQYEKIARSGKATAAELQKAFRDWHEAEDKANYTFGERFKDVWRSIQVTIKQILNDILKYYTERFIVGLISGLAVFRGRLSFLNYAPAGGAPFIPLIPGIGAKPTPPVNQAPPRTPGDQIPPGGGVVPIPNPPVGGGGRSPAPPGNVVTSFPLRSMAMGGWVPPGVIQPALLHGPELIIPQQKMSSMADSRGIPPLQITNVWQVSTIDAHGISRFVNSDEFTHQLGQAIVRNQGYLTTSIKRGIR